MKGSVRQEPYLISDEPILEQSLELTKPPHSLHGTLCGQGYPTHFRGEEAAAQRGVVKSLLSCSFGGTGRVETKIPQLPAQEGSTAGRS